MLNVQFSDSTQAQIVAWFAGPQDPAEYPNQGDVKTSDSRWKTYHDALPPELQALLPAPTAA